MDKVRFYCKGCGTVVQIDSKYAGQRGKCPKCQTPNTIPHYDEVLIKEVKELLLSDTHIP